MLYIKLVSHDKALLIDRMSKMIIIMLCLCAIAGLDYMTNPTSFTPITAFAAIAVQLLCAKYWSDIIILRNPWKNCWEFKG